MDSDKIDNIKETYINKTRNVVEQFRTTKKDTKTIFNKIIEDHVFTKSIEKKRTADSPFKPYIDIQKAKIALDKEYKIEHFLTNYNFNAQTADEQNLNYPIYQNLYDEILYYNRLKNNLYYLSQDFKEEFSRSYSQYFILLGEFAEKQNNKNYLILLSILFQITGLVFLIFLFRVLISEN